MARSETGQEARDRHPRIGGKLVSSVFVIVAAGILASTATYSAFSITDSNTGNQISTATICLEDSQGGINSGCGTGSNTALINIANATPSTFPFYACVAVDYINSDPSPSTQLDIYTSGDPTGDTIGSNLDINIQRGADSTYTSFSTTTAVSTCNSSVLTSPTTVYATNTLSTFLSTYTSDGSSLADTSWSSGGAGTFQVYLITITALGGLSANQTTNGTFGITWQVDQS